MEGGTTVAREDTSQVLVPSYTTAPTRRLPPMQLLTGMVNPLLWQPRQNFVHSRINHVMVDEAQEAPNVVLSMFSVNSTTTIVLFDSEVSHSFISTAYVKKHNIQ
jgi:hypothetical protein